MKYLEKFLRGFLKDRRGVTPVVGVILMVAVTVVMGAVIAGFVYGYVGTTERGPLISLSAVDNPADYTSFVIKHNGGELVVDSDWKLSVTLDKGTPTIFSLASVAVDNVVIDADSGDLSTGTVLKIAAETAGTEDTPAAGDALAVGSWYHVVVVYVPANSLLLDTNVQVR